MNIQSQYVYLKDISYDDIEKILKWYSRVDHFKYATGKDIPVEINELTSIYKESVESDSEFFTGIYKKDSNQMIGILKGRLESTHKNKVWIRTIVIDPHHQRKGYGRESVRLSLSYLKAKGNASEAYLAVAEENVKGRQFWEALGFDFYKKMFSCVKIADKQCEVVIMQKKL
ncbi:GNAT family N-acetyltransferase [Pseudobacteroides sp.]|uniref:GNAT family N-acetyltransferase n=1 Tax=Pseudobacteroides sp. TaxID=1968840 RepID=UPI002F928224